MTDIVQRVAMKAVIVQDGKILLLREATAYQEGTNAGRYDFPGGRVEPGEHFADGLLREVAEETGLQVKMGRPLFVSEWMPVINGVQNHIVAVFIICEIIGATDITLSQDHDDYQWADVSAVEALNTTAASKDAAKAYFEQVVAN
jgi:8-oxo-dGTP diphosphatase